VLPRYLASGQGKSRASGRLFQAETLDWAAVVHRRRIDAVPLRRRERVWRDDTVNKRAGAPPTIVDVARQAGVSIKTVSRVMNKEPAVQADTRARVQAAVAALNYRPQLSARSLAGARSFLIGLLYYDPSAAFVAGVQQGATLGCREAGRHLVVESLQENAEDV
jgi:hypothetical protein